LVPSPTVRREPPATVYIYLPSFSLAYRLPRAYTRRQRSVGTKRNQTGNEIFRVTGFRPAGALQFAACLIQFSAAASFYVGFYDNARLMSVVVGAHVRPRSISVRLFREHDKPRNNSAKLPARPYIYVKLFGTKTYGTEIVDVFVGNARRWSRTGRFETFVERIVPDSRTGCFPRPRYGSYGFKRNGRAVFSKLFAKNRFRLHGIRG